MSITDELRTGGIYRFPSNRRVFTEEELTAIADRINAEHEKAIASVMNDALYHANDKDMADLGWVRLPKDADGEYVHIGDLMVSAKGHFDGSYKVKNLVLVKCDGELSWSCQLYGVGAWDTYFALGNLRHYKQPTIEDMLHELIGKALMLSEIDGENELVAEYAKRLTLRGDGE